MKSKLYRFVSAVAVAIAAFFELCFTGAAERSWRLARTDSFRLSLAVGVKVTPAGHPTPRPGIIVSRGAGAHPPASAPHFLRRLFVTAAIAIVVVAAIIGVARPDGLEDVKTGSQTASADQATEGPSSIISRGEKIFLIGCILVSVALLATAATGAGFNPP